MNSANKKPDYKYIVEITGEQPAEAKTVWLVSAINAATQGINLRAERGAKAIIRSLETGRIRRQYATNDRGCAYEM
jgi:hypothetical protein